MSESLKWIKSTYSSTGNCVEVGNSGRAVLVRDSKADSGLVLRFSPEQWRRFAARVKTQQ